MIPIANNLAPHSLTQDVYYPRKGERGNTAPASSSSIAVIGAPDRITVSRLNAAIQVLLGKVLRRMRGELSASNLNGSTLRWRVIGPFQHEGDLSRLLIPIGKSTAPITHEVDDRSHNERFPSFRDV